MGRKSGLRSAPSHKLVKRFTREFESVSVSRRRFEMTQFPVFSGKEGEDPVEYLRDFKRACVCNGDKTAAAWLELLPMFLYERAWKWHRRQTPEVQTNWEVLTRELQNEFQLKKSYPSLLCSFTTIKQHPEESVREFSERVRDLQGSFQRCLTCGARGSAGDPDSQEVASTLRVEWMALGSFVAGLLPLIQELVSYKDPKTFDEALAFALRKELSLKCMFSPPL